MVHKSDIHYFKIYGEQTESDHAHSLHIHTHIHTHIITK